MKKILRKILPCILVIFIFVLSGCTSENYTLIVNEDDTVDFTIKYVVDRDTYDALYSYGIDNGYVLEQKETSANQIEQCDVLFQEMASIFYNNGFKITAITDTTQLGFQAVKTYQSASEFNSDIDSLYSQGIIGITGKLTISESLLKKQYTFSGTMKYVADKDFEVTEDQLAQIKELYDTSNIGCKASLRMPGNLSAIDGGEIEKQDGTSMAVYKATYDDGNEVNVRLRTEIPNTILRNIIIVIIVAAVAFGLFFLSKEMKKKKERQKLIELYGEEDEDDEY